MFSFVKNEIDFAHKLDRASSPKDEYDKHMHVFYELILFVRGDVDYHVEGETRHLRNGDIILMNPGKYHFASVNRDVNYERYVLKFPVEFIPPSIRERLKNAYPFFSFNKQIEEHIKELDILNGLFDDGDMYLLCRCKIQEIMIYLASAEQNDPNLNNNGDIISVLINYIQEHIRDDLTLESIANDMHYSESYLSNQFKKTMKCPLMKYIRSKKIILAQSMIRRGEKATDVAEELSFSDYSTFYRSYIKTIGVSPLLDKANYKR